MQQLGNKTYLVPEFVIYRRNNSGETRPKGRGTDAGMNTLTLYRLAVLALGISSFAACAPRRQPPAPPSPETLYREGMAAYSARRYDRAIERLEAFARDNFGDPRVPEARLTLGRARVAKREYVAAAADFQRVVTDFPTHPLGRDARFGMCDAYSRLSPRPQLDPEYTNAAIGHCEAFARAFPGTPDAELAKQRVAEMRAKLAQKAYENGMFYFKRRAYDAAVIYFEEAATRFPDTHFAPTALLRMYESYQRIGYTEEAAEVRARLLRDYAASPEARNLAG